MILRKYRWSRNYESAEEELVALLANKNVKATRWVGEEFEDFEQHEHEYDKQLWCVEGSIVVVINDKEITLQAGDTLDIPSGTDHKAKAGFSGVVCYESPCESL
jgi:quercetin dioxygenase-like cupin family protein